MTMMVTGKELKSHLVNQFGANVRFDEPMARHTSFKIGGPADAYVMPGDEHELAQLVKWVIEKGVSYVVIGKGTNLLVKDRGIRGVVISLAERFKKISSFEEEKDVTRVTAMAGVRLSAVCRFALKNSLSGLNFALGIPGSVGGAILMNAGAAGGAIDKVTDQITILSSKGDRMTIGRSSMNWSYRGFSIQLPDGQTSEGFIVLSGDFLLKAADRKRLHAEAKDIINQRKATQPVQTRSAGCFFKNPPKGDPAGKLIDMAGLKGFRIGGAEVSKQHANFIVNHGGASAQDIIRVAAAVQETVVKRFDVKLETEVKIIGE